MSTHVLIMAGGSGTRFWPKSRAAKPKQLLALWDDKTLLEHTVARFAPHVPLQNIWVVTTESLVAASRAVLGSKYSAVRFLGEPMARNTAACILWGAREISRIEPGATIAVMPADHYIGDETSFHRAVQAAVAHAEKGGGIVTLGIKPVRPETGYGYIEMEGKAVEATPVPVKKFVEKPDAKTAAGYLESGRFVWNAGMFILKASTAVAAFAKTMPSLSKLFDEAEAGGKFSVGDVYPKITKPDAVSVDYGVMERAVGAGIPVAVVPSDCGWNDVGSFPALEEIGRGSRGDVVSCDSSANVVQTDTGLVALLGVNDLVIVREGDVVLVAAKSRAQDVKILLDQVKAKFPDKG